MLKDKRILISYLFLSFIYANVTILLFDHSMASAQEVSIPNFWDKNERFIKPDMSEFTELKFITSTDFPPFSFIGELKQITGFNVDLARAICLELGMQKKCLIQALPWNAHEAALSKGTGTALISGVAINAASRRRLSFTRPYLGLPARFAVNRQNPFEEPLYKSLDSKTVGVVANTAQEAYLKQNFGSIHIQLFQNIDTALNALAEKKIDAVFADALSISFQLHSRKHGTCCRFAGGPYTSASFFGNGLAIAVLPKNKVLLKALNFALHSISEKGIFSEIYLRYFPEGLY